MVLCPLSWPQNHLGATGVTLGEGLGPAGFPGVAASSTHWQQSTVHGANSNTLLEGSAPQTTGLKGHCRGFQVRKQGQRTSTSYPRTSLLRLWQAVFPVAPRNGVLAPAPLGGATPQKYQPPHPIFLFWRNPPRAQLHQLVSLLTHLRGSWRMQDGAWAVYCVWRSDPKPWLPLTLLPLSDMARPLAPFQSLCSSPLRAISLPATPSPFLPVQPHCSDLSERLMGLNLALQPPWFSL